MVEYSTDKYSQVKPCMVECSRVKETSRARKSHGRVMYRQVQPIRGMVECIVESSRVQQS